MPPVSRRSPRISQAETERRVLDSAVGLVNASGLTVSLEHLSFELAIQQAGVSRTAAYRIWPQKSLFLQDLLRELATAAAPAAAVQDVSLELIADLVRPELSRLADAGVRHRVVMELIRQVTEHEFEVMYASTEWRTYLALTATFASLQDGALRQDVQAALAIAQQGFIERLSSAWQDLAALLGYRLRADLGLGYPTLAALLSANVRGLVLMALSDPELATRTVEADPFGLGKSAWSLPALGCATIAVAFLEPDPEVAWSDARTQAAAARLLAAPTPMDAAESGRRN